NRNLVAETVFGDPELSAGGDGFGQRQEAAGGGAFDQGDIVGGLDEVPQPGQLAGAEDSQGAEPAKGRGHAQCVDGAGNTKGALHETVAALQVVAVVAGNQVLQPRLHVSRRHI